MTAALPLSAFDGAIGAAFAVTLGQRVVARIAGEPHVGRVRELRIEPDAESGREAVLVGVTLEQPIVSPACEIDGRPFPEFRGWHYSCALHDVFPCPTDAKLLTAQQVDGMRQVLRDTADFLDRHCGSRRVYGSDELIRRRVYGSDELAQRLREAAERLGPEAVA